MFARLFHIISFFLALTRVQGFIVKPSYMRKSNKMTINMCNNKNPKNYEHPKFISMDSFDLEGMFDSMFDGNIPQAPKTEDEIVDDSFEGFLRDQFINIPKHNKNELEFSEFLSWKTEMGLVLTEEEVRAVYDEVCIDGLCDLMQFILVNQLIDEINAADYRDFDD